MSQKKTVEREDMIADKSAISVCDIMNTNANNLIEKIESLLPTNMQMYSDFYSECLHSLQDLFGACYISENEILSKMGINQKAIQSFDAYAKTFTKSTMTQIEMANNVQKTYLQTQILAIKTLDEYIRLMLDYYARILSNSLKPSLNMYGN